MILIIDNYDSFTFNLVQYIGEYGIPLKIVRNNAITIHQINQLNPQCIIISPGPGWPHDAGISLEIIKSCGAKYPILGVCLGHQSIGQIHGSNIVRSKLPIHGKTSLVYHNGKGIFQNISNPFIAARYHSLVINNLDIPTTLSINAWTDSGVIMGCYDKRYPMLQGIQFHPESLWTIEGKKIILNFLTASSNMQIKKQVLL